MKKFPVTNSYSIYFSCDLHPEKPCNFLFWAVDRKNNKYAWDELKISGTAATMVQAVRSKLGKLDLVWGVCEKYAETGNQLLDSDRDMQKALLDPYGDGSNKGIFTITVHANPHSVGESIKAVDELWGVDDLIQPPQLFIFDNCVETIRQIETYQWDTGVRGIGGLIAKPQKKDDDFCDCIRIFIKSNPCYVITKHVTLPQDETVYDEVLGGIA